MSALWLMALIAAVDPGAAAIAATLPPELELVSAQLPARLGGQPLTVEWRTPPRPGHTRVWVTAPGARAWVVVTLAARLERPVAARALPAGHVVAPEDVVLVRAAGTDDPASVALVVGSTTRDAVPEGAELTRARLVLPPPLPRGAALTVSTRRGALTVSRPGRLELAARVGERAWVRLDGQPERVRARLISGGHATLDEEDQP